METSGVYSQIGKGFDMLVNEGAINLVASQIGHQDTSTMSHPQLTKLLSDNLKQLQENYYQMVTEAKKQTCNLTFNSNHSLPFTVLLDNNLETFTFDALDGLNHYIISASNILYH